ncbi:hypothetical protein AB0K48_61160, partial [Nonomuraea sp. NPDC055795]
SLSTWRALKAPLAILVVVTGSFAATVLVLAISKAYRRLWSKASETEAAEHVNEIGDAIYELFHEKGTTVLEHTPGVQLVGRTIWALEADSLLKGDPALWPSNPFDLASGDLTIHYVQNEPSTSADEDGPRG